MTSSCWICKTQYYLPYGKGITYLPKVCSYNCFIALISRNTKLTFPATIDVTENKSADLSMRSYAERRISKWFSDKGIKWQYEPYILRFRHKTKYICYIPDFYLPDYKTFIEVKWGVWESSAITKILSFRYKYPAFYVIDQNIFLLLQDER